MLRTAGPPTTTRGATNATCGLVRRRVRVIGYDHRGHGASDECPQEAATIENLGRDLAA